LKENQRKEKEEEEEEEEEEREEEEEEDIRQPHGCGGVTCRDETRMALAQNRDAHSNAARERLSFS